MTAIFKNQSLCSVFSDSSTEHICTVTAKWSAIVGGGDSWSSSVRGLQQKSSIARTKPLFCRGGCSEVDGSHAPTLNQQEPRTNSGPGFEEIVLVATNWASFLMKHRHFTTEKSLSQKKPFTGLITVAWKKLYQYLLDFYNRFELIILIKHIIWSKKQ